VITKTQKASGFSLGTELKFLLQAICIPRHFRFSGGTGESMGDGCGCVFVDGSLCGRGGCYAKTAAAVA